MNGKVSNLNAAQADVVNHSTGPLLVVAGAGTGKTHVITEKIQKLIDEGTPADKILALTFTEKAASEMLGRIVSARSTFNLNLNIMTFNAFGELTLRKFATDIGISPRFKVLGENAKVVFLKQHIDELQLDYYAPVGNPDGMLSEIADYFSKLKQDVITPEDYKKYAAKLPASTEAERLELKKHQELAAAYEVYLQLSRQNAVVDYDDQIFSVIELLQRRPNVREKLRSTYDYILIDEFQDTNPMQSILIDMLVNDSQNLIVVGDDDQSIYGFRGANLSNILTFTDRYKSTKEITLIENYRSSQEILDASYALIINNNPNRLEAKLAIDKKLKAQKSGAMPSVHHFDALADELLWIANDVSKKLKQGIPAGQIAVICRRNITAKKIHEIFAIQSIDHVVIGNKYNLYSEPLIRSLIEALNTIANPHNTTSLYHTLAGPLFSIDAATLGSFVAMAKRESETLYKITSDQLEDQTITSALEIINDLHNEAALTSVGHIAFQLIERSGLKDKLYSEAEGNPLLAQSVTRLAEYFDTLKEFEGIAVQPSVMAYIDVLPVLQAAGEIGEDDTSEMTDDKVNVLTIHKSKGLEWQVVYVPDCTEGSFPLRPRTSSLTVPEELLRVKQTEADDHYAEERRLMYVAATRAKSELIFSRSLRHSSVSERKISRFMTEMSSSLQVVDHAKTNEQLSFTTITAPTSSNADFRVAPALLNTQGKIKLSVSMVDDFIRCPRDFYYRHILRVPQEPKPSLDYGIIVHGGIEEINKSLQSRIPYDIEQLIGIIEENWPKEGYISKLQRERAINQAKQTLQSYHERLVASQEIPVAVESSFKVLLSPADVELTGRFDAVFPLGDGVEIRDYKTSADVDTPEKAKSRASSSTQLTLYALAWSEMNNELPKLLSLEFVETGMKGSIKKTERGVTTMISKIGSIADNIKQNHFPEGSDHRFCVHPESNNEQE